MNDMVFSDPRGRKKIIDNRGQIRQVFQYLQKHFDVLADALDGALENHDKARTTAIQELASINALLPYGEESYHLNPHLRHYLKDHLNLYQAFESLTRISPMITQARLHWHELCDLQQHGEHEDAEQVEDSLDHTITNLIHSNERNLMLLTAMVSSEYGNVASLRAKIRQNEHYRRQVVQLLKELISVEALLGRINENPYEKGEVILRARQMVNARLTGRRAGWVSRLNDIQAVISRKLFLARKLEQQLYALSQAALWLSRNPTTDGIDLAPSAQTPAITLDALCRPTSIRVRPQIDFTDRTYHIEEALERALRRLPAPASTSVEKDHGIQRVHAVSNEVAQEALLPADQLIAQLVQHLQKHQSSALSLLQWQIEQRHTEAIADEIWILYASSQLLLYPRIELEYHIGPALSGHYNDRLEDVTVRLTSAA
ncbi:hypothetical protein [Alcaligenes endophyticus]|uniref:Phosphoenolpyruvate carboxylase n=1 Tax=Alcaligenes endophyticus TaxID=1929088 RepID=A0ABT8EH76_9BURK|nr:hypothetical protein [Alcaligenes endophyticus]MCX5589702.1 hypothetical protein [Alcaligenes endophyticus]MDN4120634.1 hypothetical protein [Alcaligenes endophyticus]